MKTAKVITVDKIDVLIHIVRDDKGDDSIQIRAFFDVGSDMYIDTEEFAGLSYRMMEQYINDFSEQSALEFIRKSEYYDEATSIV